jgi:hypothetical protein
VSESQEDKQTIQNEIYEEAAHVLPKFITAIIDKLLLPLLMIAEAYLMGSLFALGWVKDIEDLPTWGWYHGIGVVVFFLAGAATAGLTLRASVALASCIVRHRWGFAFLNLLTVVGLTFAEMWASIAERSLHLASTPADGVVLDWVGYPRESAINLTLLVVAVVLPFTALTYGFSQQRRASVSAADMADEEADLDRQLMKANKMADIRAARAGGLRQTVRAFQGKGGKTEDAVPLANGHQRQRPSRR